MDVRLILDPPAMGSVNMAVDEALLESASGGQTILRFYAWVPATLSLGYFQRYEDRQRHAASESLDCVRRSTGGGAIVHDRELTYSFATPISERFSGGHQQLVRTFHETLCESLANWKIEASLCGAAEVGSLANPARQTQGTPFLCFERRAPEDVIIANQKVAGSAQRRRRNGMLQHGSVLLSRSSHAPELPGIADLAERSPSMDELREVWSARICDRLGIRLVRGDVTPREYRLANGYRFSRYEATDWQLRR